MRPPREDTQPWYKQFWPWFLISLPLSVVIASIVTINLAIQTDDGLVSDDYYKEGLAIHMDADSAARAAAEGVAAQVTYDPDTGAVTVVFDKALLRNEKSLLLSLVHPTRPEQDQLINLLPAAEQTYAGRLATPGPAQWKIEIQPQDKVWRIDGRLPLPDTVSVRLD